MKRGRRPRSAALLVLVAVSVTCLLVPASVSAQEEGARSDPAPRWWGELGFGLANPLSDLGKVNDSGPLLAAAVGRALPHPFAVRAAVTHVWLQRGGLPRTAPWNGERPGPLTDLLIVTMGPSVELTPEGPGAVDLTWSVCAGVTRWEATGTDVTEPFTDTDPTGCVAMDATMNLGKRWAVNARYGAFMIHGNTTDANPFVKEVVQTAGLGVRLRF